MCVRLQLEGLEAEKTTLTERLASLATRNEELTTQLDKLSQSQQSGKQALREKDAVIMATEHRLQNQVRTR